MTVRAPVPSRRALSPPPAALWLADRARPILLRRFTPDCCIESTVAALDFLRARGVACRELSVQVMAFNAAAWKLYRNGSRVQESAADRATWDMLGAWSVGIGFIDTPTPKPGRFAGHLVALVEERWLLDLSIQQASRPRHKLRLDDAVLAACDPAYLAAGGTYPYAGPDGSVLVYGLNRTFWGGAYAAARSWRDRRQRRLVLDELAAAEAATGAGR